MAQKVFNASLFKNDKRKVDRYFGGNLADQEPYLSGYIFAKFYLPQSLNDLVVAINDNKEFSAQDALAQTMISATIPGATVNKTTFSGLGGRRWSVPTSVEYTDSISLSHTEFSGTPISKIYSSWVKLLRDPLYGLSPMGQNDVNYDKTNYAGKLLIWMTDPTGKMVEKAYLYTGIYPMKDPMDSFSANIETIDKVQIDIDFNVDMIYDGESHAFVRETANTLNDALTANLHNANLTPNVTNDSRYTKDIEGV